MEVTMATKLAFAINYCQRDAALAQNSAVAVKRYYPDASVVLIDDSKTSLKLPPNAGQWTQRWMTQALATGADIVIKIDPDTRAMRTAMSFPTADVFGQPSVVGTYYPKSPATILYGACIGFQKAAAEKIVASNLLLNTKYNEKPYVCEERRYGTPRFDVILNDPVMDDVTAQLGLSKAAWSGLDMKNSWDADRTHSPNATFVHPVRS
jgi:hypothetical protein